MPHELQEPYRGGALTNPGRLLTAGWGRPSPLWDYSRATSCPGRRPGDARKRCGKAVLAWNGALVLTWIGLAAWPIAETESGRLGIVAMLGIVNIVVVVGSIFPGREGS
jgi:hypothetical protein